MLHRVQKRGGVPPSSFVGRAFAVAAALALAALLSAPATPLGTDVVAQTPTPTPLIEPADPRTDEPPGLTGTPLLAAAAVIVIGTLASLATLVYVRLVARR